MVQMPRGEPRSVPDPDREGYDEMLRQEALNRAIKDEAAAEFSSIPDGSEPFTSSDHRLEFLLQPSHHDDPTVTINGRKMCIFADRNRLSQAELAAQRQALDRVSYMAGHPLAGAAYGMAALAGASPGARDQALMVGGIVDTAMLGAAPFGAQRARQMTPPQREPDPEDFQRPSIRYGNLNANGQASGVAATLTAPMISTGTRANWRLTPPGWQGNGRRYNEARGHLLANQLGGTGGDLRNLVTLTHRGANSPQMKGFENNVARRVGGGEVVEYSATPMYDSGVLPPSGVLVTAYGSRGTPTARFIPNPAGRPR